MCYSVTNVSLVTHKKLLTDKAVDSIVLCVIIVYQFNERSEGESVGGVVERVAGWCEADSKATVPLWSGRR